MKLAYGSTEVYHQFIFELRYERGELYWDRCGRIARKLAALEGWASQSADANGCHIWNESKNLTFTFSTTKIGLIQVQSVDVLQLMPVGEFAVIAEQFSDEVVKTLELDYYPRIGFRVLEMIPAETIEDASVRIEKMSLFSPSKALTNLGELSSFSHHVVVSRSKNKLRVGVMPFEQAVSIAPSVIAAARNTPHKSNKDQHKALINKIRAEKAINAYPATGVMIDLDAYIEDFPYPDQVSIRTFILDAMDDAKLVRNTILTMEAR